MINKFKSAATFLTGKISAVFRPFLPGSSSVRFPNSLRQLAGQIRYLLFRRFADLFRGRENAALFEIDLGLEKKICENLYRDAFMPVILFPFRFEFIASVSSPRPVTTRLSVRAFWRPRLPGDRLTGLIKEEVLLYIKNRIAGIYFREISKSRFDSYPSLTPEYFREPWTDRLRRPRIHAQFMEEKHRRTLCIPVQLKSDDLRSLLPPPFILLPSSPGEIYFIIYLEAGFISPGRPPVRTGLENRIRFALYAPASLTTDGNMISGFIPIFSSWTPLNRPRFPGDPFTASYRSISSSLRFSLGQKNRSVIFQTEMRPVRGLRRGDRVPSILNFERNIFHQNLHDFSVRCVKENLNWAVNRMYLCAPPLYDEVDFSIRPPTLIEFLSDNFQFQGTIQNGFYVNALEKKEIDSRIVPVFSADYPRRTNVEWPPPLKPLKKKARYLPRKTPNPEFTNFPRTFFPK